MGSALKIVPHYSYDDWVHWEGSWELIEGYPFAMSPSPVPEHQRVASEIRTELTLALRHSKCKSCRAYDPLDYKISDTTIVAPDILVVCGKISKPYLDFPPALVVEILSPSTALKDRHTKFEIYQAQGIPYYLIVDINTKAIEVFEFRDGAYHLKSSAEATEFRLSNDCSIQPNLSSVFD
jgi:Uma2 family endonuclease